MSDGHATTGGTGPALRVDDYRSLVVSPEAHTAFLRHVDSVLAGLGLGDRVEVGAQLHKALRAGVEIGGLPFSQPRHLKALEAASETWDLESVKGPLRVELVALTERIQDADQGYALADFTVGFQHYREGDPEPL